MKWSNDRDVDKDDDRIRTRLCRDNMMGEEQVQGHILDKVSVKYMGNTRTMDRLSRDKVDIRTALARNEGGYI